MPNELSIQAVTPAATSGDATTEPKTEVVAAPAAAAAAPATPLYLSPALRLEPGLGLVVIEFRDATGNVTSSIPSQRQLQAYRLHQETPPGETAPAPVHPAAEPQPAQAPAPIAHVAEPQTPAPVPKAAPAPVPAPVPAPRPAPMPAPLPAPVASSAASSVPAPARAPPEAVVVTPSAPAKT